MSIYDCPEIPDGEGVDKVESLTAEEEARIPEYREKWIKIGLSTEPVVLDEVKEHILQAYDQAGLARPKKFYHAASPLAAAKLRHEIEHPGTKPSKSDLQQALNDMIYGPHEAGWLSFYEYVLEVTKLRSCMPLRPLMEIAKRCGWYAPYEDYVIIQSRPTKIKLDENNQLHCENGPAILFEDGFAVYAWRGNRIPREWIEETETALTPEAALSVSNSELRLAACEILGWHNILKDLNAVVIDKDPRPTIGELLEVDLPENGKTRFLQVFDPCGDRVHALRVPTEMRTAHEANAWTWNKTPEEYNPEVET